MKVKSYLYQLVIFFRYLIKRIEHDRVNVSAGYMTYITLLSLVPMLAVLLSVLSIFPVFSNVGAIFQKFVFTHLVPTAGDVVFTALSDFVANTGNMTAVGGAFLFVAALALISNIDKNLNYIWRVKKKRRMVVSFSLYWMILTLGPLLLGSSIAASSYLTSLLFLENKMISSFYYTLLNWLPFLLYFSAFVGLYLFVPNKKVQLSHAIIGSLVASLFVKLTKIIFVFYIVQIPSYQMIYGAMASIPILFIWVFLCWFIVLIGAEVTASLGERELWESDAGGVTSRLFKDYSVKNSYGLKNYYGLKNNYVEKFHIKNSEVVNDSADPKSE